MPTPEARNPPVKTRGRPFQKGNPGKRPGARAKTTLAAEALLDGEAEKLTRKAIELALEGDTIALRLCLERILPVRKGRPVPLALPNADTAQGVAQAMAALIGEMACGNLSGEEAATVASVLEAQRRAIETVEIEARLAAIEERIVHGEH